jgi:hypothetical protein
MRLLLVALVAARMVTAADSALNFLPADTSIVIGIRVSAIRESALFKDVGTDAQKLGDDWMKLVAITGFDPIHDIDEILIFAPAANPNAAALIAVRGRFNLERMGVGAQHYHGVALVGGGTGAGGTSVVALLDATTAVAGEPAAVRAAIDRRGHGAPLEAKLAARVQSLATRYDIWGTGERPEGFVPPTGKNQSFESIDRFEFGMRISKGLELGAEIHARLPSDAEQLAAMVLGMKAMMSAQGQAAPPIDVQVKDGTVKISLVVSEEDLRKAVAAQRAQQGASAPNTRAVPGNAPKGGGPVVNQKYTVGMPANAPNGTNVFVLPGKQ